MFPAQKYSENKTWFGAEVNLTGTMFGLVYWALFAMFRLCNRFFLR